ncbi:MAG: hypothetical protein OCC46_10670 [Pseudodesulfovibrio sp.]
MAIDYTVELKEQYVMVVADATTDSPAALAEYIDSLLADSAKHNINKILMDHRKLIFETEHAGAYDLAAMCIEKMQKDRPLKIALLVRPERMEVIRIYETIGVTRGVDIKAFQDRSMASSWLTS